MERRLTRQGQARFENKGQTGTTFTDELRDTTDAHVRDDAATLAHGVLAVSDKLARDAAGAQVALAGG